ncbi:MAG: translocation/assembly module TamB domain-containing protein [Acidobacteria bacterium]|nr:translocation/assembly module TamB domain-containing protein [Acidobacteriota bacterium]
MTRRLRLALTAALLLGGLSLLLLPQLARVVLVQRLSSLFRRDVTVRAVRFYVVPFQVEVTGLRVAGSAPGGPPFLEVPRAEIVPSFASLVGPHVALARLRLQGLVLRINAFPQGGDDIPKVGGRSGGGGELRIRRLVIEDGAFLLNHARVPLELDLPEFRGRLAARRGGALAGTVHFGGGTLQFGTAPPLGVGADLDLVLEGSFLTLESGHLRSARADLAASGRLKLQKDPVGEFALRGPLDLDELERHVMRTGFGIKGDARYDGTLEIEGPRLRFKGRLTGTAGEFDGVPVPRYAGFVAKDENGTHIQGLEVETLGGAGVLDIEVPPAPSIATLDARFDRVDAEGAVRAIFDLGPLGVGAASTGTASIRWPRGRIRHLSGAIAFDMSPREDGRTPLEGRFEWTAKDGLQKIGKADLRTPATWVRLAGSVQVDDRTDMRVDGESRDLAASDDLFLRLRRALGTAEAQLFEISGSGLFRGRWTGTLAVPVFTGRFTGVDVGYLGVVWGRAEWAGTADPLVIESRSLVVRRPGGEIWLDGRTETGLYGERDGIDVRVRFQGWPAPDFIRALEWRVDVTGLVSGEATVTGRRSAPFGTARVSCPEGRYYGIPFEDLDVTTLLEGDLAQVPEGRARVGGGDVVFEGTLTDDEVFDGTATARDVEVGEVLPAPAPEVPWGGRVSGEVTLQGTLERPRVLGRFTSPRLFLGDEGLGALTSRVRGVGDGRVTLEAECRSHRVALTLSGSVGAAVPHEAALRLSADDTSVDPFLRKLFPAVPIAVGIVATGTARLDGPLATPERLHFDADLPRFELLLPEYPIRNREPVRLSLDEGRLSLRELRLAGEGTDLAVRGSVGLLGAGVLDLAASGAADLRALSAVTRRLRGQGAARLGLTVSGTRAAPAVEGTLDLEGAGLRVRGFPHGLEGVHGRVRFTEAAAEFAGVTGTLGGGTVELEGQSAHAAGRLTSFDVHGTGRGLTLRYPEGLRSVVDADLRLYGDAARQWLAGAVDVRQALYTRRYDVASELLATREAWEARGGASLAEGLHYGVKLRVPGTLRIDNNLATLQARADLTLQGTYDSPAVLGRAQIERGRIYFQGNTYVIRRGTIDFANPQRIDPLFDIEAETRLRSYRVTLKVNGTLERVYPTLSSDPPLSAVQILNLLAGADESTVASLQAAQADQARLAATGAATLAAGKIAEEVGLERGAERLFGLNRFSIDPSVVKGGVTNPTARLTVGKRITPDLNVLYSVDLRGTEERLLSVEYTLSDRLSVLLTRTEPGGFGFDLRLRRSY